MIRKFQAVLRRSGKVKCRGEGDYTEFGHSLSATGRGECNMNLNGCGPGGVKKLTIFFCGCH